MLASILSLIKSTKPYLWCLSLISYVLQKTNPNNYALTFVTTNFMVFANNMIKFIGKNVKAGPLRKLTECIGYKLNMSKIWLCSFERATNHHCNYSSKFWIDKFLKNVQKLNALQNWWQLSDTRYPKERILNLSSFCSEVTTQTRWRILIFIVIHSITTFDVILASCCWELSAGI